MKVDIRRVVTFIVTHSLILFFLIQLISLDSEMIFIKTDLLFPVGTQDSAG